MNLTDNKSFLEDHPVNNHKDDCFCAECHCKICRFSLRRPSKPPHIWQMKECPLCSKEIKLPLDIPVLKVETSKYSLVDIINILNAAEKCGWFIWPESLEEEAFVAGEILKELND